MSSPPPPRGLARRHEWSHASIASVGDTVIVLWRGPSTFECMETLGHVLTEAIEDTPSGITFLSVVERASTAPGRDARDLMRHLVLTLGPRLNAVAWAVDTTALLAVVAPVINASLLLSRRPIEARFFLAVPSAADWLVEHTSRADARDIVSAVERMRARLDDALVH